MCAWFSWGHIGLAGLASDIAGAFILALSFMSKKPATIAREIPLHGMSFGLPRLARSLVQQRVEAWIGLAFLVVGFMAQSVVYFTAQSDLSLHGWREFATGAFVVLALWATAFALWKWWLPGVARRMWNETWRTDYSGQPLTGDELERAERSFGPGGGWGDLAE